MRRVVLAIMLCTVQLLGAQVRIIPNERLFEVANPKVVNTPLKLLVAEVNFGTIDEMSGVWQGSAELLNTGAEPIVITQTKSTCGCLQVSLPKRVIASNEKMTIALKYYPRGHAGKVAQKVLIYTNHSAEHPSAILQLRGVITASADRSDDYPYSRGVLRLRQEQVRFSGEGMQTLRIACMNGGSAELSPKVDTLLTSKGVQVRFEPSKFAPKQEGSMVVQYRPIEDNRGETELKIYLKLPGLAPRQGIIKVIIDNKD